MADKKTKKRSISNSETKTVKNPCSIRHGVKVVANQFEKKYRELNKQCEETKYKEITKYFNVGKATNKDLIEAIKKYYTDKKSKDIDFKLSFNEFINLFPRDTSIKDNNFKKQHIFEQICRLLLFFNYDKDLYGKKKEFYPKLETYTNHTPGITLEGLLKEHINEGSKAGSVDIFFKILEPGVNKNTNDFVCEKELTDSGTINKRGTYILVQNKFYSKESSDISKYDATKIFTRASKILDHKINDFKIVLMVNSSKILNEKLKYYDKLPGLDILGVKEIDSWFQDFLFDLDKNPIKFESASYKGQREKYLQPRFHQKLFIESSLKHYKEHKKQKYIWGAVPRSGKSYIIGGMISERAKNKSNNDIVIIMGAKAETEKQFKDLLDYKNGEDKFKDFEDYGFIGSGKSEKDVESEKDKNIYLFSQELLKYHKKSVKFSDETIKKYPKLFKKNKIDIYFDEIHKGGSTDKSKDIIEAFINHDKNMIDMFIMVTATFAKPNIAYEGFLDNQSPVVLQWGYEDQQLMKNIDINDINIELIKQSRNNEIDKQIIDKLLNEYNDKFGGDYLKILSDEYKKHPELILINPLTLNNKPDESFFKNKNLTDVIFKLKDNAVDYTTENNKLDISNIFENSDHVTRLIEYLTQNKGLYEYLKHDIDDKMQLDVFNKKPTQLWFLPISKLFNNHVIAKGIKNYKTDEHIVYNEEEQPEKKMGVPHIEPITRGVALAIMNNEKLEANYNVLIVHNDGKLFDKSGIKDSKYKNNINCITQSGVSKVSLVDKIKQYEEKANKANKGLIILTGSKLRLGVSLPCADIALNFDNIQSIDSNYQTMFRVLTERKNHSKKFGYYVDFNLERTTQFVYDFAMIYSNKFKKLDNSDDILDRISNIYELLNFNGNSFSKAKNMIDVIRMYKDLNNKLGLDRKNISTLYLKNYERTIGKILLKHDITKFKEINNIVKNLFYDKDKISYKNKGAPKDGAKKHEKILTKPESEPKPASVLEPEEELEDDDNISIINNLRILIPTIVTLLSIFSNNQENNTINIKCLDLENCLDISMKKLDELKDICNCEEHSYHPIGCYLKKFKDISNTQIKQLLEKIKKLIFIDNEFDEIKGHLIFLFDNIKTDFKMNGGNRSVVKTKKNINFKRNNQLGGSKKLINSMNNKDIIEKIEKYLPIRTEMKDKHGEVFTPYELIKEMMDKLKEIDSSVFKNPHLKWLDPANGTGNFPMVVFTMLNEGLKGYNKDGLDLRDEGKRKEYIIKNMLYMVELQPDNVMVSKKIFGKDANIFCGSFLPENEGEKPKWLGYFKDKEKKIIDSFDIIMGNPPYNEDGVGNQGKSGLDNKFILNSLKNIKNNGYLVFITKTGWRSLYIKNKINKIINEINNKTLIYSKVYDFNENPFGENVLTNFFIIKNAKDIKNYKSKFIIGKHETIAKIIPNMNIYFLFKKYLLTLKKLKEKYGNLGHITRGIPKSNNYLLISHRTGEVHNILPQKYKNDEFYVIENPNKHMKDFFKLYFKDLRYIGRFAGFSTAKTLFYDIPDFNKIPNNEPNIWKEFIDEDGKPLKTSQLSSTNSQNNSPNKSKKNNSVSQSNKNKSKKKRKLVVVKKLDFKQNISKNTKKNSVKEKWSERKPKQFLRGYSPEYNKKDTKYINTLEKAKQISESLGNKSGGITQEGDKKYTIRKGKELKKSTSGEVSWKKL